MFFSLFLLQLMLFYEPHGQTHIRSGCGALVAEKNSNHYLVQELFWPLEFRIYIFRPMQINRKLQELQTKYLKINP